MPGTDPTARITDQYLGMTLADRYLIKRRIGQGAMGAVYEAEHEILGRTVAVKILHRRLGDDAGLMRRFMNEARAVGGLRHVNVVESYDVAVTPDGLPFLVLEFIDGHTLAREIKEHGPMAPERAVGIISQAAAALHVAHERGIVHRDVKPGNVMLLEADAVKVLDFGISKFGASDIFGDQEGAIVGSPHYMAPEQVRSLAQVDRRADIYALGALLYEMLSGVPPFHGIGFPAVLRAVAEDEPKLLEELVPSLDASVAAVVRKAMHKDPAERFQTAPELAMELMSCVSSVSGVVMSPALRGAGSGPPSAGRARGLASENPQHEVGAVGAQVTASSAAPATAYEEWKVPLLVGVLIAIIAVMGWTLYRQQRPAGDAAPQPAAVQPEPLREAPAESAGTSSPGAAPSESSVRGAPAPASPPATKGERGATGSTDAVRTAPSTRARGAASAASAPKPQPPAPKPARGEGTKKEVLPLREEPPF